jgi:hypothetical protein
MTINWPLITVLFCFAIPGTLIAIKRLIYFLLPDNTAELKKRITRFAMIQTLTMVFIMSFCGAILADKTGLHAPILEALLEGKAGINALVPIILPTILYSMGGLIIFCILYYSLAKYTIDKPSLQIMTQMRLALGTDGCVLYGGVVEEIIGRWGLMNLATFFALIFTKQANPTVMWLSIVVSGLIFAVGQLPAYLAAGCTSSRQFIYSYVLLSLSQSLLFGFLFWQYGIICSILAHMLFHCGWALYDAKFINPRMQVK